MTLFLPVSLAETRRAPLPGRSRTTTITPRLRPWIRDYLVRQLQHVSVHDQQWGVWGAGPANPPGTKDGREQDPVSPGDAWWITNAVGFAGPAQEYTLSIMGNLHNFGGTGLRGGSSTAPTR